MQHCHSTGVLDIVSVMLLVKAAQARARLRRVGNRCPGSRLLSFASACERGNSFRCVEYKHGSDGTFWPKWKSLCQNLEIHLCILAFLIFNSEERFMSVERRAFLFAGPVLCPCVNSASHDWHNSSQIFNCETAKHICSTGEGKDFGGFFRLGCRETNCKSRECQACKAWWYPL